MKAQHFARNILAAAVLSALGAHAAVAADFSEGVYENRGEQQEFENFTVKNADGADLDNSAGVFIRNMGTDKGSLTVKQQFRVDVSSTETPAQVLKGVHVESESRLELKGDADITVKNTAKPSDADVEGECGPHYFWPTFEKAGQVTLRYQPSRRTICAAPLQRDCWSQEQTSTLCVRPWATLRSLRRSAMTSVMSTGGRGDKEGRALSVI